MEKKKDLRQSLVAKCAAILLLFAATAGAVLGSFSVTYICFGYGTADKFQNDLLCKNAMSDAMGWALDYTLSESEVYDGYIYYGYNAQYELERLGGFSAQVYDANGALVGTWGEVPASPLAAASETLRRDGAVFTVKGYVARNLPSGSGFSVRLSMYNRLHALPFGMTVVLTVLLYALVLAALVFLFCAAGHKAGKEGVSLNWQDRIPLDLYLCIAVGIFCAAMIPGATGSGAPIALEIAMLCLSIFFCAAVTLATLLTLATRFKKGKWWRNTVVWRLCRWSVRTWKRCWRAFMELVRILPMTWRVILAVLGILGVQSILVMLILETYESFFFLLMAVALDAVLVVGAAWLSLQLQKVCDMGSALAAGDLDAQLDTEKMYFDVKRHGEDLNAIGVGMNKAVEQRLKSERLKTELITNVSHDIKTPLTSIVNYVDLLKKEELPPAAQEYLQVLDRQSHRLKKLTEDLVEASKASTGNMTVSLEPIVVNEIIHQAVGDYDEKLAAGKLEVIVNTYEGNLMALADGRLLWRVLDNLLSNVCKYAMAGTRVYVDLAARDGRVYLSMKNISRDPLNVSAEELMERFVRGDASRHTEGSGLGLNIARSLMDLMGGGFELYVDGDLFKAELSLRA